jgi:SRSO17 transposase
MSRARSAKGQRRETARAAIEDVTASDLLQSIRRIRDYVAPYLVLDGSATPKKGVATVGVARQWCGRFGKRDNCVVGVYAAYVGCDDAATLVDCELFLPREWVDDPERRTAVDISSATEYRTQPAIAKAMSGDSEDSLVDAGGSRRGKGAGYAPRSDD